MSDVKKLASILKGDYAPKDEGWSTESSDVIWRGKEPHSWVVFSAPPMYLFVNGVALLKLPRKKGRLAWWWFKLKLWWILRRTRGLGVRSNKQKALFR